MSDFQSDSASDLDGAALKSSVHSKPSAEMSFSEEMRVAAVANLQRSFNTEFNSFSSLTQACLPDFMANGGFE